MSEENMCPGRILRNKYIPVEDSESIIGVPSSVIENCIKKGMRYAEFLKEGARKRTPHFNPDDYYKFINRGK